MASGFFGKLPASGDFLARGLPIGLQSVIDRWLTRHLAEFARTPELWPQTGLKALLASPHGGNFALLIIPSHDAPGRHFPLAICASANKAGATEIEVWATKVHPIALTAIRDAQTADQLQQGLTNCTDPTASETPLAAPVLWADGPPADPAVALRQIFSSA